MAIRTTEIHRLPVSLRAYDKHADRQGWMDQLHDHLSGMQ